MTFNQENFEQTEQQQTAENGLPNFDLDMEGFRLLKPQQTGSTSEADFSLGLASLTIDGLDGPVEETKTVPPAKADNRADETPVGSDKAPTKPAEKHPTEEDQVKKGLSELARSSDLGLKYAAYFATLPDKLLKESGAFDALKQANPNSDSVRNAYRRANAIEQIDKNMPEAVSAQLKEMMKTGEGLMQVQRLLNLPAKLVKESGMLEMIERGEPIGKKLGETEVKNINEIIKGKPAIATLDKVLTPQQLKNVKEILDYQEYLAKNPPADHGPLSDNDIAKLKADYLAGKGRAAESLPPNGQPIKMEKTIHIVMGLPGSCKTSVRTGPLCEEYGARLIDADYIKPEIPNYRRGFGNQAVHDTSSQIADELRADCMKRGENIVISTIGRNPTSVIETIEQARAMGYKVAVHLTDIPPEESARRIYNRAYANVPERFGQPSQFISPYYALEGAGYKPQAVFNEIVKIPGLVDSWTHFDTTGKEPKLVAQSDTAIPTKPVEGAATQAQLGALEAAKGRAHELPLRSREQVAALLKGTLDEMDKGTGTKTWSSTEIAEFARLVEAYKAGDAKTTKLVHERLGLKIDDSEEALKAGTKVIETTVSDVVADALTLERRAAAVASLIEKGPIRGALMHQGMPEDKARKLEKDLLSEDKATREKAIAELNAHCKTKEGMKAFAKEAKGRLGSIAIVASPLLPFIFDQ